MTKKFLTIFFLVLLALVILAMLCSTLFLILPQKNTVWGVNFSQMQSEALGLDWKENYLALLADLGVRRIKLLTQWDFIEGKKDIFYFNDVDWQLAQAKRHNASVIYVVGMKTGRWPECHVPGWAEGFSKEAQQSEILDYIRVAVTRNINNNAIIAWQAENEPLFDFGICPWYDEEFLKKEVALIKSIDPTRPVIVSDSGEQSTWLKAAKIADMVGVTMYTRVALSWNDKDGVYFNYPIPPIAYWIKARIVKRLYDKDVIGVELQAEPWAFTSFDKFPLKEQEKSMNLSQLRKNIQFARETRLGEFYLWGSEWWFWLKEKQNKPEMWEEARELFIE